MPNSGLEPYNVIGKPKCIVACWLRITDTGIVISLVNYDNRLEVQTCELDGLAE